MRRSLSDKPWIVVATADPSKFSDIIEPLLNIQVPVPEAMQVMLQRKAQHDVIEPNLESAREHLMSFDQDLSQKG